METQEAHCTRCKGTGTRTSPGFTALDGTVYPERTRPCSDCNGRGSFPALDVQGILILISTGKKDARRFRKSWPSKANVWRTSDVATRRAYYVWRMARFHGGADVTMPMTAMDVTAGDPHKALLDRMADLVAKRVFGTDRAAAARWGGLLGFSNAQSQPGLPASAYEGGPVVTDGKKPWFEAMELK
jgi:hypothetical protein